MENSSINQIFEQLKNGEIKEYLVKRDEFLEFRQILVKRPDFKYFHGIAQRGGDVLYQYMKEPRS